LRWIKQLQQLDSLAGKKSKAVDLLDEQQIAPDQSLFNATTSDNFTTAPGYRLIPCSKPFLPVLNAFPGVTNSFAHLMSINGSPPRKSGTNLQPFRKHHRQMVVIGSPRTMSSLVGG
jgi:hypothetical protein